MLEVVRMIVPRGLSQDRAHIERLVKEYMPDAIRSNLGEMIQDVPLAVQRALITGGMKALKVTIKYLIDTHFDEDSNHDCEAQGMCTAFDSIDVSILFSVMNPWEIGSYARASRRDAAVMAQGVRSWRNYRVVMGLDDN